MHSLRRILTTTLLLVVTATAVNAAIAAPAAAVVGGQDATTPPPGVATVQIFLPGRGTALCGGGLVTSLYVLTAAHCVSDDTQAPNPVPVPAGNIAIRVGSIDRTSGGTVVTGSRVFLPPDWAWASNPPAPVSDYALVELTHPVPMAVLPLNQRTAPVGGPADLIGWGLTEFPPTAGPPTILQQRATTRLPDSSCAGGGISLGELCLGDGACYGDSGSPALHQPNQPHPDTTTDRRTQIGIASRETDEAQPCAKPTIYTDTSYGPLRTFVWTTVLTGRRLPCSCTPVQPGPNSATHTRNLLTANTTISLS